MKLSVVICVVVVVLFAWRFLLCFAIFYITSARTVAVVRCFEYFIHPLSAGNSRHQRGVDEAVAGKGKCEWKKGGRIENKIELPWNIHFLLHDTVSMHRTRLRNLFINVKSLGNGTSVGRTSFSCEGYIPG